MYRVLNLVHVYPHRSTVQSNLRNVHIYCRPRTIQQYGTDHGSIQYDMMDRRCMEWKSDREWVI